MKTPAIMTQQNLYHLRDLIALTDRGGGSLSESKDETRRLEKFVEKGWAARSIEGTKTVYRVTPSGRNAHRNAHQQMFPEEAARIEKMYDRYESRSFTPMAKISFTHEEMKLISQIYKKK